MDRDGLMARAPRSAQKQPGFFGQDTRRSMATVYSLFLGFWVLTGLIGCGGRGSAPASNSAEAAVSSGAKPSTAILNQQVVLKLASGQVVREMNERYARAAAAAAPMAAVSGTAGQGAPVADYELATSGSMSTNSVVQASPQLAFREGNTRGLTSPEPKVPAPEKVASDQADPCAVVPKISDRMTDEGVWRDALKVFGACLRKAMVPVELARGAMIYEITFNRSVTERPLSKMLDSELGVFLKVEYATPGMMTGLSDLAAPKRLRVRNRFDDRDLDEMVRLSRKLNAALSAAMDKFFAAVDENRNLVEHFARKNNRYQLLLILRDGVLNRLSCLSVANQVAMLISSSGMGVPASLTNFPIEMLNPWSVVAIAPDPDKEDAPLQQHLENPFDIILRAQAQMGGSDTLIAQQREIYTSLRAQDNPPLPQHDFAHPQAVRVAVVDTGVDYLQFPDLGKFLSNGQGSGMKSYDYQDDDLNPYIEATGMNAHGSGTAATVLSLFARYAPDELYGRKLDLAMWKLNTIRDRLASPHLGLVSWQSREALPEALIRQALDPKITAKPNIVSISAIFELQPFLTHSHHEDAVLKAPWLWVMAAGNEGVATEADQVPVCLNDVPSDKRIDGRILCVGALRHSILTDQIAGYSNYGDRVDLYAYESYIDLCPNGTSCSTPAISGAAAVVAAKYPQFTPEDLKEVLVNASERKTLTVDTSTSPQKVPLIDSPSGMLHISTRSQSLFDLGYEKLMLSDSSARIHAHSSNNSSALGSTSSAPIDASVIQRTVRVLDPATMMPRVMEMAEKRFKEKYSSASPSLR